MVSLSMKVVVARQISRKLDLSNRYPELLGEQESNTVFIYPDESLEFSTVENDNYHGYYIVYREMLRKAVPPHIYHMQLFIEFLSFQIMVLN